MFSGTISGLECKSSNIFVLREGNLFIFLKRGQRFEDKWKLENVSPRYVLTVALSLK